MKDNLEILLKVFGVIGSLVAAYLFIKKAWTTHINRRNLFYTGNWNNQGQIRNIPSHYLDMDVKANGNKFSGRFNVRKVDDETGWEMFGIKGKRRFGKFKCTIVKGINEEGGIIATGILKKNKPFLKWNIIEGKTGQFPKETMLRKGLPNFG